MRTLVTGALLLPLLPSVAAAQERAVTFAVAMKRVEGVVNVAVDYDKKRATVRYDDAITMWETIATASASVGFPADKVDSVNAA